MSDNSVDWEERALRAEAKLALRTGEADAKTTIIKELEAKLAKAVEALEHIDSITVHSGGEIHGVTALHWQTGFEVAQREATIVLAELKGGAK